MKKGNDINAQEAIELYVNDGNQEALAQLYTSYTPLVNGVCLKYLKDSEKAQDAVMSVYELLCKKLKTNKVDEFRPWLYVVTKNYCLDLLRKEKRKTEKEKEAFDMYSEDIFHPDSVDDRLYEKLQDCIKALTEDQQLVIDEFYFKNKAYQVIAEEQDISWNRVRSRIQNGRRMLKICLEK